MQTTTARGRPCTVCAADRQGIEAALVRGDSVSTISQQFRVSSSSMYRHISSHLSPELRSALRGFEQFSLADLTAQISEIARSAREASQASYASGNVLDAVRAGDAALRALAVLVGRLGIDNSDVTDALEEAQSLALAVGKLARRYPLIASELAGLLADAGAHDMAGSLVTISEIKEIEQ